MSASAPRLSVVIPYFEQQPQLDLTLRALALQTLPAEEFEVIVVDDGSDTPPKVGERSYRCTILRQADRGFRASAARALGAQHAQGATLAFLDADTVPTPDYLGALLHVVESAPPSAPVLAVGRRRHADLTGWQAHQVEGWMTGEAPGPTTFAAPAWLSDAYVRTRDLMDSDERAYRFVISAVMAMSCALYHAAGGFDPDFIGYGGEDWELAHRCWQAGAQFRHVPDAVAWHDGPDFGGRDESAERRHVKNMETMRLAHTVPDPVARGRGLRWETPESAISIHGRHGYAPLIAMLDSLLTHVDAMVWLRDEPHLPTGVSDNRVLIGDPSDQLLRRARRRIDLYAAIWLPSGPLRHGPGRTVVIASGTGETIAVVEPTRHNASPRGEAVICPAEHVGLRLLPATLSLERWWSTRPSA